MKNILVAIDGSASSNKVVSEAVKLASDAGAAVTFLNVIERGHINKPYHEMAELELSGRVADPTAVQPLLGISPEMNAIGAMQARETHSLEVAQLVSDRVLDEAVRIAVQAGLNSVKKISAYGDAASEIVKTAASMQADLVVVGRHGMNELVELFLGSVSQKVLHRTAASVLVVS